MKDDHVNRLDLNLLTIFDAVMTERSLTKAGVRLGVSQSAVSHALSRLRDITGNSLFERTGHGVRPTARAAEMADQVRHALDMLRATLRAGDADFSSQSAQRTFQLDIAAGLDAVIIPKLAARTVDCSNLQFRISGGRARDLLNELRYGDTCLALECDQITDDDFGSQLLFEDHYVVIAAKGHPALKDGLTLDLFQKLDHVALSWAGDHALTPLGQNLESAGISRRVKFSVPNLATIPGIVEADDVIACMPEKIAHDFSATFDIELHRFPNPIPSQPVYMVWHKSFDNDPSHKWLRGVLNDICHEL